MSVSGQGKSGVPIKMTEATDYVLGKHFVNYMRWVGATTAGHQCIVQDKDGNNLFESIADGQYFIDVAPIFDWVNGITLQTRGSGTLYIHHR